MTETHVLWKHATKHTDHIVSPLVADGRMLLVKGGGIATCFETSDGDPALGRPKRINNGSEYFASPIFGDGKIYIAGDNGVIVVLKNGPELEILEDQRYGRTDHRHAGDLQRPAVRPHARRICTASRNRARVLPDGTVTQPRVIDSGAPTLERPGHFVFAMPVPQHPPEACAGIRPIGQPATACLEWNQTGLHSDPHGSIAMIGRRQFGLHSRFRRRSRRVRLRQSTPPIQKKPAAHEHHEDDVMSACAKACSDCQRACDSCSTHCASMLKQGQKEHAVTLGTCLDCADFCAAASQIVCAERSVRRD